MPTYLAMGMTSDEYWKGDPYLTVVYRKAWELKKEQRNHEMWWQGFYNYEAVASVMSALFHKSGRKPEEYPREPHRLTPLSEIEKAEKKEEIHNQLTSYFQAKIKAFERYNVGHAEQNGDPGNREHK